MRFTQFHTATLYPDDAADSMPFSAASVLVQMPGGAYDPLGGRLDLQARRIARTFSLTADPEEAVTIQDKLDALQTAIAHGRGLLRGELRDGTAVQTWAKVIGVDARYGSGDLGQQPITLTFELPYPYLLASADEPAILDDGDLFDGAWSLDYGNGSTLAIDATSEALSIDNTGPVPIPRHLITVTPQAASEISGLTIHNTTNHYKLAWAGTLTAGETLYIDTLSQLIHVDGTPAFADLTVETQQPLWMRLEPGVNAIAVTATSVTGDVDLAWYWSRHYLL